MPLFVSCIRLALGEECGGFRGCRQGADDVQISAAEESCVVAGSAGRDAELGQPVAGQGDVPW